MAVASPRSLSRSLSLCPPFVSVSLPAFLPLYSPTILIVLFVLPLALNSSHTTYVHVYTPTHTYTNIYLYVHVHTYTYTCAKCIPCFRSLCVRSFDPSSSSSSSSSYAPSSLLFVPLTSYYIRVSRSENSSVGPG